MAGAVSGSQRMKVSCNELLDQGTRWRTLAGRTLGCSAVPRHRRLRLVRPYRCCRRCFDREGAAMTETVKRCCGTCAYGMMIPKDLTKRLCHGNPPQILVISMPAQFKPGPPGSVPVMVSPSRMEMQNARPIVPATDPPCAHYEPRSLVPKAQDNEVTDHEQPEGLEQTRQ